MLWHLAIVDHGGQCLGGLAGALGAGALPASLLQLSQILGVLFLCRSPRLIIKIQVDRTLCIVAGDDDNLLRLVLVALHLDELRD